MADNRDPEHRDGGGASPGASRPDLTLTSPSPDVSLVRTRIPDDLTELAGRDIPALRQLVLAVSVFNDVDVVPHDDGVSLPSAGSHRVSWSTIAASVGTAAIDSECAQHRTARLLRGFALAFTIPASQLRASARPIAFVREQPDHPGADWVRQPVLGGALDLGLAFAGLDEDPDRLTVIPQPALDAAGVDDRTWWSRVTEYLDQMALLGASRLVIDGNRVLLRQVGDCDVLTLLGSAAYRRRLVANDAVGFKTVAAPMRSRGWVDLTHADPAYLKAAVSLTAASDRGVDRALFVSRDEVTLAPEGASTTDLALRDPVPQQPQASLRGSGMFIL